VVQDGTAKNATASMLFNTIGAYGDALLFGSWTEAAAATYAAGDAAIVFGDAGTHTDPVVGGTVANEGVYIYSASPAGLKRVDDLLSQLIADAVIAADTSADLAQASADEAAALFLAATTGRPEITTTVSSASSAGVYIFAAPETVTRNISKMRVRRSLAGSINIDVAAYTLSGGQFTRVRGPVAVTVPEASTSEIVMPSMLKVRNGEYLGYSIPGSGAVGIVFLTATTGDNGGYYYHNAPGATGPFTPSAGLITSIQLQIGFDGSYAEAYSDVTIELQPQITANATSTSVNASAINDVSQLQPYIAVSRAVATYSAWATGSPSTKAWATGFLGTSLPSNAPLDAFPVTVHRGTGIETFEAMLYSRPIGTTSAPSGSDTALWGAWVSVNAAGVTSGAFGEVTFTSPVALSNDQTKAYLLVVRAKNSGGTIVDMGYGRVSDATISANQVERGFYRDATDTAWTTVNSPSLLNIKVQSKRRIVRQAAIPSSIAQPAAPRKNRGTVIMWGRTQLVFSNATPKTYRRVFALPANVSRVVSVIFAHGGTSSIQIARAAVAPIASAANYAAAGATWTALSFGTGTEGASIPAAAGSLRLGWLASNEASIGLLDRTDTPGAAKLVAVSAYCSTASDLTLLGSATDTDDYRTNWQIRSDFPSVMRRNDGDCVTTPASFASTTNEKSGTMIAGLVVECDTGELLTIGATGDSITNGAGITVSSDNTYGLGWVEGIAYAMNTAHRGVMPVMLGWSGISMAGIANIATDYYAFLSSAGLPSPNIFFVPNASPNSITPPITSTQMTDQLPLADGIARSVLGTGGIPVIWTIIPTNPSVKDYNGSDSFRRDYNDTWRTRANAQSGYVVADFDAVMAGTIDGDGQMNLNPSLHTDGIHPNAVGHAAIATRGISATRLALPALGYAVGGLAS